MSLALQERIAAARSMGAQGVSRAEIAAELGVYVDVVGKYPRARLCECGESYVVVGRRCNRCANRRGPVRAWTREGLLAAIVRWSDLEGRPPTSEDWQSGGRAGRWSREYPAWPRVKDVQRSFGSWNEALRAAGFTPVHPIGITTADVIAALQDAHDVLGDRLTYKSYAAWAAANRRPSTGPLVRHFGTFNGARQAAGITANRTRSGGAAGGNGETPSDHAALLAQPVRYAEPDQ